MDGALDPGSVPKKRGRKKKDAEGEEDTNTKLKSRRGRKTKNVFNAYAQEDTETTSAASTDNVIVQLKIEKEIDPEEYHHTSHADPKESFPVLPNAYNTHDDNTFQSIPMMFVDHAEAQKAGPGNDLKVIELLKEFEMKSKTMEWPTTTNICCYWCCHQFKNPPFGIPIKYTNGIFHVYGCFCGLECAAAYNFDTARSCDEVWERYQLINLLARSIDYKQKVKVAPPRLTLKMFGGYMDINEFRQFSDTSKFSNINFPPMLTMTQQIEELNETDVISEYKYIPLDIERINRYKEKITMKRTKPVKEFKNTLDSLMNLKIN
jgi:hypothetical protein